MAIVIKKLVCVKCRKSKNTVNCSGCERDFCLAHINEHYKELSEQQSRVEEQFKQIKNTLETQYIQIPRQTLIKEIDNWEKESIETIRQVAARVRGQVSSRIEAASADLNSTLTRLTDQLCRYRKEDDFGDKDVRLFDNELKQLKASRHVLPDCKLGYRSKPFIDKIHLVNEAPIPRSADLKPGTRWAEKAVTVAGGNGAGDGMNQLDRSKSVIVGDDHTLYIADTENHRIMAWKQGATTGRVIAGGNWRGDRPDQLCKPIDVIIDQETDSLIISDYGNGRVVRWSLQNGAVGEVIFSNVQCWGLTMDEDRSLYLVDHANHEVKRYRLEGTNGTVVAGGNGSGTRLNQLQNPTYVFVDQDQSVYVSDCSNHRVTKWTKNAKTGILVAGSGDSGNALSKLSSPNGIVVDELGCLYVVDSGNSRIMRWNKDAREGTVIVGGNDKGNQANQLTDPTGLSFARDGDLYVVDSVNHRVQRFEILRNPYSRLGDC